MFACIGAVSLISISQRPYMQILLYTKSLTTHGNHCDNCLRFEFSARDASQPWLSLTGLITALEGERTGCLATGVPTGKFRSQLVQLGVVILYILHDACG